MIDKGQLLSISGSTGDTRLVEKDYLLMLLLYYISKTGSDMVFKGGTALKMFYNLNRASEDLDFSYIYPASSLDRNREATVILERVLKEFNLQYRLHKKDIRTKKQGTEFIGINYEIAVAGPLYDDRKQLQNINMDVSLREDAILPPKILYITPLYPDIPTFSVAVMDLNEILAEKICAITERDKIRDTYDVYFILKHKGIKYDGQLVKKKMELRGEHFDIQELINTLHDIDAKKWKSELYYLVHDLPSHLEVIGYLAKLLTGSDV